MVMGMILRADKASVIIPIVIPPSRKVTQQQHRFTHGILISAKDQLTAAMIRTENFPAAAKILKPRGRNFGYLPNIARDAQQFSQ